VRNTNLRNDTKNLFNIQYYSAHTCACTHTQPLKYSITIHIQLLCIGTNIYLTCKSKKILFEV